jgi:hypothetical protein
MRRYGYKFGALQPDVDGAYVEITEAEREIGEAFYRGVKHGQESNTCERKASPQAKTGEGDPVDRSGG